MHVNLFVKSIFFILLPIHLFAQEPDSLRRPDIYLSQVDMHKIMPMDSSSIVFLGNSITFWGNWSERFLRNGHVKNRGIPGDNTFGVLDRLKDILLHKPRLIFLMIGVNDLAQGFSDAVILSNLSKIVKQVRMESPRTKLVLQSILPVNPSFGKLPNHEKYAEHIPLINLEISSIAKDMNCDYFDLYRYFSDGRGHLKKQLTWDGVHLTEEGYQIWQDILIKKHYF